MGAIKGRGNLLEMNFHEMLRAEKLRFKMNVPDLPGKPDVVFRKNELVIFVDGCFWHGCKKHFKAPISNNFFWEEKIARNIKRDLQINEFYKSLGWKIVRVWEHQIKGNPAPVIKKIKKIIKCRDSSEVSN